MTESTVGLRDEIIAVIVTLPAMRPSSVRLLELVQNPDHNIEELVDAIEFDPGLTANLLRWANSAYFGGVHQIASVRDAAVRLGTSQMGNLITTSCTAPVIGKRVVGYDLAPGSLLEHSMMVAIGTNVIAKACNTDPPSHTFTAALLHDIGKIALGPFIKEQDGAVKELARKEELPFDEAERSILGIDHQEVGALLLKEWNIPGPIVEAVRWHHQPSGHEGEKLAIDLVHAAEILTLQMGTESGIDGKRYRLDEQASMRLGLGESSYGAIIERMVAEMETLREVLSSDSAAGA